MARLSGKSKSYVERVWQWPKNVRRTGWGLLHDRLWFPCTAREYLERPGGRDDPNYAVFNYNYYRIYMDRRMLWFRWGLRLHTFYQGDDDAAVHDHPWWFITFPLRNYTETVMADDGRMNSRLVRGWHFHFRRATHRHFVHEPSRPLRTIILTGSVRRNWGFWPDKDAFVPYRKWANYSD